MNVFENLATPDQLRELNRRHSKRFDDVCQEISSHVSQCCAIVSTVAPLPLLQRCYWHWLMHSLEAPAEESRQSEERSDALQMLEYVQQLICAVGSDKNESSATDQQFAELTRAIRNVFRPLKVEYFICRSARLSERADYDVNLDEFCVRTEMSWIGVRGHRYLSHEAEYFRKILAPQSDLLKSVYRIGADEIAAGVENILLSLSKDVITVAQEFDDFRADTMTAIEQDSSLSELSPPEAMEAVIKRNGWEGRRDSIFGRFLGTDLFDVEKVTNWPSEFVYDLSLKPGEDVEFADPGYETGWPTKLSQAHFAPFIRGKEKSFCFQIYGLTDRLYRTIERALRTRHAKGVEKWNQNQKRASEDLTARLFSRLLPGADVYRDCRYWATNRVTGERIWTECDLIVVYERQLFVIEVKAGRYTHKAPGRHILDHLSSLKDLIENAASQANRLLDELASDDNLVIHDAKRNEIVRLQRENFDRSFPCCVSLDQLEDVGSRAEDLAKLNIDIGPRPIWTVSLNDLLVCADIFRNPLVFIDYLVERLRAFASPICHVSDELDHLGLYLQHNRYVMRAEKFAPMESLGWRGYRDSFDRFYSQTWQGRQGKRPAQEMSLWIEQVLNFLAHSRKQGRVSLAHFLLSMNGETRDGIAHQVSTVLAHQQQHKRPRPISSNGDVRLTISVSQRGATHTDFADAREHALTVMTLQAEIDRLVIWLQYSERQMLEDVKWAFLSTADLASVDSAKFEERVAGLQRSRRKLKAEDFFKPAT